MTIHPQSTGLTYVVETATVMKQIMRVMRGEEDEEGNGEMAAERRHGGLLWHENATRRSVAPRIVAGGRRAAQGDFGPTRPTRGSRPGFRARSPAHELDEEAKRHITRLTLAGLKDVR